MSRRTKLPTLLLIVVFPMLACQMLLPAPRSCRVNTPASGWVSYRNGEQVAFRVDTMDWKATVDCASGQLVDGQPARPERAKEILIPVGESAYKLITTDPDVSMSERHQNGSHVRIVSGNAYYLVSLTAVPAAMGNVAVSYFMGGQASGRLVHLYCYNRTAGEQHASLPALAAMWTVDQPVSVSLICSGRNFVLEASAAVTMSMLRQGPTVIPAMPAPTITPAAPGSHL
jgi:hypothetical protein